ncbi:acyl-CoA dehydrogenase family protein [Paracoccus sp. MC1862]|uniref:acyl-CoA dehydrogenase family protein n=1 Tax=Paracoccus sp. MC1862 TaxID=2760307 RepID=UPI00190B1A06|nr:acyl-CoA dehydrogenase family protein [Paracoccus sp. MC1862]QQO43549.1 acyl-CoA dehydrogenase family protein [Paracoccus sp. MC1862]
MDFTIPPRIEDYRRRIARFVEDELLPLEEDRANYDAHENIRLDVLEVMRDKAKAEGWCLQLKQETGGQGLGKIGMAVCYEEMNRSIFGPVVFNSAAPDDGNMMVLEKAGTPEQKARWLQPIVDGRVRSAFVMTEPHPGSGSDPGGMMLTTATRQGDSYVIRGRKWFITGAEDAGHFMLIARTSEDPRKGLSAFLFHRDTPGWRIERRIPIMGPEEHGGHCELVFEDMEIPAENLLLNEGDGLKLTQMRLGPARLTHCMRWLGLSKRCVEIATTYAHERFAFGERLSNRESIRIMLGDLAMQIEVGRLLVMKAAWALDQGSYARKEVSMAKVHVANLLHKAADTAIQINGARGYSKDTPLEWIYRYARQARLVDGADEVHKMVLSRNLDAEGRGFWSWPVEGDEA